MKVVVQHLAGKNECTVLAIILIRQSHHAIVQRAGAMIMGGYTVNVVVIGR